MLILLLLLTLQVLLWVLHKDQRKRLITLSLVTIAYHVFWTLILTTELGGGTYGTDELRYYTEIQSVARGIPVSEWFPAPRLVEFGSLILRSSPSHDVIWLRLANILVFSLTVTLIYILVYPKLLAWYRTRPDTDLMHKLDRRFVIIFLTFACNGIVVWTVIRVLKETLVLFLITVAIYAIEVVLAKSSRVFSRLVSLAAVAGAIWAISGLRSGGQYLIGIVIVGSLFRKYLFDTAVQRNPLGRFWVFFLMASIIGGAVYYLEPYLVEQIQYIQDYERLFGNYFDDSATAALKSYGGLLGYPLSFMRFFLGPGPIRALQQLLGEDIFIISTRTADVLVFLGALHWWIVLVLTFLDLLTMRRIGRQFRRIPMIAFDFTLAALAHIGMYVFLYAGTGDTRHRAVMYVLLMPLLVCIGSVTHVLRSSGSVTKGLVSTASFNSTTSIHYPTQVGIPR